MKAHKKFKNALKITHLVSGRIGISFRAPVYTLCVFWNYITININN